MYTYKKEQVASVSNTSYIVEAASEAVWHNIQPGDAYDIRKYILPNSDP